MAAVSDLVLENYANANLIWREGAVDGSRRLRVRHRQSAAKLLALGIPPARIGIMIGFQTGPGAGGREGLRPRSRWFSVAKWHALAVKQVAKELELAHVWSWGWAQRDERSNDPDKTLRRLRLAMGSRREPVRRADRSRPRARYGHEDRAARSSEQARAACTARRR